MFGVRISAHSTDTKDEPGEPLEIPSKVTETDPGFTVFCAEPPGSSRLPCLSNP